MTNLTCPRLTLAPAVSDFSCSRVAFGMWRLRDWQLDANKQRELIEVALQLGITTFDHAAIYGDYTVEGLFGGHLRQVPSLRSQMEVVTKCGIRLPSRFGVHDYDTSAQHIKASVEDSLRNLGTDYIDLLLIHRPDALLNADEVAEVFHALKEQGKVRAFGVSNFSAAQFALLNDRIPLVTNQVECSLLTRNAIFDGTFEQAQQLRYSPMIWSPLAGGRLFHDSAEANRARSALGLLQEKYQLSTAGAALAWLARLPSRPLLIAGSHRQSALIEAVTAVNTLIDREDWYRVLVETQVYEVP